ncbi:predicted N-acetyltransferase YhbS [Cereibacter ovatus]|uniref:Predicted N-acetyltransferase YhbS n=1 Tax=Cereibacter ovatus TaxID=439529 RepID=A0A285CUU2_9RHOB|nr:GNAT family N-acetyltransferase [Cereibacter ovatus]SNX71359.1 predicted N-acetyltransferase YhbS [Cereibacter ovatus]
MTIRTMTEADLERVLDWAAAEGWNPGLDDARPFLAADPQGFFLAERDGRPVAAISVVNHDATTAFLGLYLCLPEWRGRGIGYALWSHALAHAGARTVGLDGVAAQQANYARSGFALAEATLRLEGPIAPTEPLRAATAADLPAILALDRAANGHDRAGFLSEWTRATATRQTVVLDNGRGIDGWATARLCRQGCKIGPVIAPDSPGALRLIGAVAAAVGCFRGIVDVPDRNAALIAALADHGFAETFRTARMYRGPAPVTGPGLQATATLELG